MVRAKNITVTAPLIVNNKFFASANNGPVVALLPYVSTTLAGSYTRTTNGTVPAGNYLNLTIKKGVTAVVNGSNYGNVTIEDGAQVSFTSSNINLIQLQLIKTNTSGITIVHYSNAAVVKVRDYVGISQRSRLNVGGPKVVFHLASANLFEIKGANSLVAVDINMPNGTLLLSENNITMTGLFTVKEVKAALAHNVDWYTTNYCDNAGSNRSYIAQTSNEIINEAAPAQIEMLDMPLLEKEFSVKVLANPTHNNFTLMIKSNDVKTIVTVKIMNMQGHVLSHQKTIAGATLTVGENSWSKGLYVAEIMQGEKRKILKLVKL